MAVAKYKDSNGNIKKLTNVTINLLDGLEGKALVSTENATLSSRVDESINDKTRVLVKTGTSVWVNAKELEGKIFNYMKNQRDEIISYEKNYNTIAYTDERVIPVYSDNEVEKKSITCFQGNAYKVEKRSDGNTIYLYIACEILESDKKKNWGILLSNKELSDEEMIVGGNVTDYIIDIQQTTNNSSISYHLNFSKTSSMFLNHKRMKARAYSIIEKNGVEEIVYSKVITIQV